MSETAENQTNNAKGGKMDDAEAEEDVILGDGFAVVDDDKGDDIKSAKEATPQKPTSEKTTTTTTTTSAAESGKASGMPASSVGFATVVQTKSELLSGEGKKEKAPKEAEDTKPTAAPQPVVNGDQQEDVKPTIVKASSKSVVADKPSSESKDVKTEATKQAVKTVSEPKEDALVITAEDDIDDADTEDGKKTKAKPPAVNGKSDRSKSKTAPSMWVSNIARKVKATDLKRVFSKHGRVVTAKIVTNGKSYFGYVSMDSVKSIERCIKYLNHTRLGDKKITISSERPDAPKKKATVKASSPVKKEAKDDKAAADTKDKSKAGDGDADDKKKDKEKDPLTLVTGSPGGTKKGDDSPKKDKPVRKRIEAPPKNDETISLKRDIRRQRIEVDRMKRRLQDEQAHNKTLQMRAKRFERAYKEMDEKMREARKVWDRERETLLKKNRSEQLKLDADRDILEKDRMELRRRREDLERELRKLGDMQRAVAERSHRRKSRSVTPPSSRTMSGSSSKRLRTTAVDVKHDAKKARWSGDRARTPPPPPKLTPSGEGRSSKRDHDHFYEERGGARRDTAVYVPTGGYHEGGGGGRDRHRTGGGFPPETKSAIVVPPRSSWGAGGGGGGMPPEQWRGGGPSSGTVSSGYGERFSRGGPSGYSGQSSRDDVHSYSHSRVPDHSRSESDYRRPVHYESAPRKY